jgi:hypothetical protein
MKMRTACLAVLPALALPLLFCAEAPARGPAGPGPSAATAVASPGAQTPVAAKSWSSLGPANFPHEKHFTELEIECSQCHHETNAKPLTVPHPEYFHDFWIDCATCHRKKGEAPLEPQACSTCHHEPNGDLADETLSAKVVIHKKCWSCHEGGTGAAASASCKTCHPARS